MKERLRRSFNGVVEWCYRHDDVSKQHATLNAKLRGHHRYYGRPTNYHSLWQFYRYVRCVWKNWVDRRSGGQTPTWETYGQFLRRHPLPRPRITRPWAGAAIVPEEPAAVILHDGICQGLVLSYSACIGPVRTA